jgi:hypothetical protein
MDTPSMRISPVVGVLNLVRRLRMVVLPEPLEIER